ncbi:helix-turn-helix transcriptional regulator [Blastococcus sp. BMG 814]|uniref:Helix-turn-helix transcriptional regulator n=1 Tax=Blastococcus carthaginiensis TaxID=3050034 RepID=A0ABT9I997_9ACTN|nr:helix-turn-helix transcriptional regulator [Blastococcus carthaginiensis]MDP5182134.1 helix-turn-helix transcriptional regulator [Blastococcus carthaginiensis]
MDASLEQRVAQEIRAELARQDRTRRWLAQVIGQPETTVARWLRGPQSPGLNELDAMCRALGVSIVDLLAAVERNGGYEPLAAGAVRHQGLEPRTR